MLNQWALYSALLNFLRSGGCRSLYLYLACSKRPRLMARLLPGLRAFLKDSSVILTIPHRCWGWDPECGGDLSVPILAIPEMGEDAPVLQPPLSWIPDWCAEPPRIHREVSRWITQTCVFAKPLPFKIIITNDQMLAFRSEDIFIAVIGTTAVGKGTFISHFSNTAEIRHGLHFCKLRVLRNPSRLVCIET